MHPRELVDLAAFVAAHGQALIAGVRHVPTTALAQYWTASKCRHDRWNRSLRESLKTSLAANDGTDKLASPTLHSLCQEILVSDMLTRVWSGIITSFDSAVGAAEAQPVAASVLRGQLEASNRVLDLISVQRHKASGIDSELNRLRRLTERWTDLLLGGLLGVCEISRFVHDADRADEFSRDFNRSRSGTIRQQAWTLLTTSMAAAFRPLLQCEPVNADLNARIAGAIVACFPGDLFDSVGVFHSLWMLRLSTTTADTQLMVDDLLAAESPPEVRRLNLPRRHGDTETQSCNDEGRMTND
jgi:hypothetical protein